MVSGRLDRLFQSGAFGPFSRQRQLGPLIGIADLGRRHTGHPFEGVLHRCRTPHAGHPADLQFQFPCFPLVIHAVILPVSRQSVTV